jgi:methionyl-tRNA formyltransferase
MQDDSLATIAPKINVQESWVTHKMSAAEICFKIRAFSIWPGVKMQWKIDSHIHEVKIITAKIIENKKIINSHNVGDIIKESGLLFVVCASHSLLCVEELQPAGKKVMSVKDFLNGVGKKEIYWLENEDVAK